MPDWDSYGQIDSIGNDIRYIIAWNHKPEQSGPIRVNGSFEKVMEDGVNRGSYAIEYVPAKSARTIRFPNGKVELKIPALDEALYFAIVSGYGYDIDMPVGKAILCGGETYYITALRPPSVGKEGEELKNGTETDFEFKIKFYHEGSYEQPQLDICYYDMPNTQWGPRDTKKIAHHDNVVVHRTQKLGMYALMARKEPSYAETVQSLDETIAAATELKAAITQAVKANTNGQSKVGVV